MLTLMTAALVAAQPAPATNPHSQHAQMPQGQMAPGQHQEHEGMKDCCKECCKGMGEHDGHAPDAKPGGRSGQ
jgi:hypothetical protein